MTAPISRSLYSEMADYAKTICKTRTFSSCSFSDGSLSPLVKEAACSNVFCFDKELVRFFSSSFEPCAADSIQFADGCINFAEFKNYENTECQTFADFFTKANLFKQLDESLLFFENCFIPAFSASTGFIVARKDLIINFFIVARLGDCPIRMVLSSISRIANIPTDPCIAKYQKRDCNSNFCFFNQIRLLTPESFDLLFPIEFK